MNSRIGGRIDAHMDKYVDDGLMDDEQWKAGFIKDFFFLFERSLLFGKV